MHIVSVLINVTIAVLSVVAWLMLAGDVSDPQKLAARGWESLKYFTVLSNLFSAVASLVYVLHCLVVGGQIPLWLTILKLAAATAVMLTFLTVVLLLGPYFGYGKLFLGGNLWMHLVLPLLALVDCWLFVPIGKTPLWMTAFALLPTLLYGAWYLARVLRHGAARDGVVYDFYGFTRWGKEKIPVVAAGMLAFSWVIALLIRLGSKLFGVG